MTVPRCRGFFPALDGESAQPMLVQEEPNMKKEAALVATSHNDIIAYCLPHFSAHFTTLFYILS